MVKAINVVKAIKEFFQDLEPKHETTSLDSKINYMVSRLVNNFGPDMDGNTTGFGSAVYKIEQSHPGIVSVSIKPRQNYYGGVSEEFPLSLYDLDYTNFETQVAEIFNKDYKGIKRI